MSQNVKERHAINKAVNALGDVVRTSGKVANAAPGYHPAAAEPIKPRAPSATATSLRTHAAKPKSGG